MTRINIIPPIALTDQHLLAEIKEINQLSGQFTKSLNSKTGITNIPANFTLGKGHVKFFYNKGLYLNKRFILLKEEAINRGFNIKVDFNDAWTTSRQLYNDWSSTFPDVEIIIPRLKEKILLKPEWYLYKKKKIVLIEYLNQLNVQNFI